LVVALVIGIVPQHTDCESQGRSLTLADGREIPMKCHWTARAEWTVAIPLFATGALMLFVRRKETLAALGVVVVVLGVLAILLPTILIGVCGSPDMVCNSTMRPLLILMGSLAALVGVVVAVISLLRKDVVA